MAGSLLQREPLLAILRARRQAGRHSLAQLRHESRLKIALVALFTVGLWLAAFVVARAAFAYLETFGIATFGTGDLSLGDLVMARLLSTLTFSLFTLLIFSNILVAFATFYRSREVIPLVLAPLSWRRLFLARFVECVVVSSWATAFLGSPILLAYGLEGQAPPVFYLALVLIFPPFVVLPAALGAMLAMLLVYSAPRLPRWALFSLGGLILGGFFLALRRAFSSEAFSGAATLDTLLSALDSTAQAWMPSHWAARAVLETATGAAGEAWLRGAWLAGAAILATVLAAELANRIYFPGYSGLSSWSKARKRRQRQDSQRLERWLSFLPPHLASLTAKDLRLFWRDPAQWSQFVLFFGILLLYVATMRRASPIYDPELWRAWITLLNAAVCMLILATLTTRFIFPLISLEGRRLWILGLAPISFRQVLIQKLWLSVVTTSVLTVGLAILSAWRLELPTGPFVVSVLAIALADIALSGLAVGLGALYPNFDEINPSRIVSGLGGTLTFILSMGYIVLAGAIQTLMLQWPFVQRYTQSTLEVETVYLLGLGALALLSLLTAYLPMRLGLRQLEKVEI
ncbi:MAG: hypothetical protein AAGD01_00595 [Acidobacteriota bacterium]